MSIISNNNSPDNSFKDEVFPNIQTIQEPLESLNLEGINPSISKDLNLNLASATSHASCAADTSPPHPHTSLHPHTSQNVSQPTSHITSSRNLPNTSSITTNNLTPTNQPTSNPQTATLYQPSTLATSHINSGPISTLNLPLDRRKSCVFISNLHSPTSAVTGVTSQITPTHHQTSHLTNFASDHQITTSTATTYPHQITSNLISNNHAVLSLTKNHQTLDDMALLSPTNSAIHHNLKFFHNLQYTHQNSTYQHQINQHNSQHNLLSASNLTINGLTTTEPMTTTTTTTTQTQSNQTQSHNHHNTTTNITDSTSNEISILPPNGLNINLNHEKHSESTPEHTAKDNITQTESDTQLPTHSNFDELIEDKLPFVGSQNSKKPKSLDTFLDDHLSSVDKSVEHKHPKMEEKSLADPSPHQTTHNFHQYSQEFDYRRYHSNDEKKFSEFNFKEQDKLIKTVNKMMDQLLTFSEKIKVYKDFTLGNSHFTKSNHSNNSNSNHHNKNKSNSNKSPIKHKTENSYFEFKVSDMNDKKYSKLIEFLNEKSRTLQQKQQNFLPEETNRMRHTSLGLHAMTAISRDKSDLKSIEAMSITESPTLSKKYQKIKPKSYSNPGSSNSSIVYLSHN